MVATTKTALKKLLLNARRVAFLGVGSELRADDAAGILLAKQLIKDLKKLKRITRFKVFIGHTAPENLTGEIKKFNPTHLIIVDAAEMGKRAGSVKLIDPHQVGGLSFCTHSLPIKVLTDYLINYLGCAVIVIGIQPKMVDFGKPPSAAIKKSVKDLSGMIKGAILKRRSP